VLSAGDRHLWSIDELHAAVVKELGAADYSTVFRAVSGFEKEGLIHRIDLGDGKVHYELVDEHHEHIRCDSCGRVVEVPGCVLEDASAAVRTSTIPGVPGSFFASLRAASRIAATPAFMSEEPRP